MHVKLVILALFLTVALPAFSQVVPAAGEDGLPLVIGAGISDYQTEITAQRFKGPTVWADWNFIHRSSFLQGVGIEAEGRDLNFGQPAGVNWTLRTVGGGPIYTWRHYRRFHPYGKFLLDYGAMSNIKGPIFPPSYTADKWMIYAPGGGVDVHAWRNVWVRADYEYQFWRTEWFNNNFLNPEGLTVGLSYGFGTYHVPR